jgi:hypothetical protein
VGNTFLRNEYRKVHLTKELYELSIKGGLAEAASNFFDACWKYTTSPGVPVNRKAVKNLSDRDFAVPCPFPEPIVIGAPSCDWDPTKTRGSWQRATAEELVHAYILAVARDVQLPKKKAGVLEEWRFHLLTCSFRFEIVATEEELFFKSARMREDRRAKNRVADARRRGRYFGEWAGQHERLARTPGQPLPNRIS